MKSKKRKKRIRRVAKVAEAIVFMADVPNRDGKIFSEKALKEIAAKTPGAVYDEEKKTLTVRKEI
jgi:hypothetical protein